MIFILCLICVFRHLSLIFFKLETDCAIIRGLTADINYSDISDKVLCRFPVTFPFSSEPYTLLTTQVLYYSPGKTSVHGKKKAKLLLSFLAKVRFRSKQGIYNYEKIDDKLIEVGIKNKNTFLSWKNDTRCPINFHTWFIFFHIWDTLNAYE